ncbi:MAG: hypothetical protein JSS64_07000 [Bacteroidetes bacterium]|nr:hypothetical protein [Bacteroidota bacterium]
MSKELEQLTKDLFLRLAYPLNGEGVYKTLEEGLQKAFELGMRQTCNEVSHSNQ